MTLAEALVVLAQKNTAQVAMGEEQPFVREASDSWESEPVFTHCLWSMPAASVGETRFERLYPNGSFVGPSTLIGQFIWTEVGDDEFSIDWTEDLYARSFGFVYWLEKPHLSNGGKTVTFGSIRSGLEISNPLAIQIALSWVKQSSREIEERFSFKPFGSFEFSRPELLYALLECSVNFSECFRNDLSTLNDIQIQLGDEIVYVLMHLDCLEKEHVTMHARKQRPTGILSRKEENPAGRWNDLYCRGLALSDLHYAKLVNRFINELDDYRMGRIGFHGRLIPLLIIGEAQNYLDGR